MKFKDWLSEWLEYYVKPRAKYRTYTNYKHQVDKHIVIKLGTTSLENGIRRLIANLTHSNSLYGIRQTLRRRYLKTAF